MALPPVHVGKLASTFTLAPYVSAEITALNNALYDTLFPIVTRFCWSAWQHKLASYNLLPEFGDIPLGLQHGFLVGLERYHLTHTFIPPNHYKSAEHHNFIQEKYAEELALGRITQGYPPAVLRSWIGDLRTAPLNVFQQTPGGKLRVTVDHSFPRSETTVDLTSIAEPTYVSHYIPFDPRYTSVNTVIDAKKFQCTWGTFSQCYLMVADAPPGTQASIFDVDAAFRNIPTHPSARPFLAVSLNGKIHLDNCLNFGASPCPGIWGRVADAMVRIFEKEGLDPLIKWVDDFAFFRYPIRREMDGSWTYRYDERRIWEIAEPLGWPWAPKKHVPFASTFVYIGFLWDLTEKTVSLPEPKRVKYQLKLAQWSASFCPTVTEVESLIGTLNHICLITPEGRGHLQGLYKLRASFNQSRNRWVRHSIPSAALDNIAWWRARLSVPSITMEVIRPPPPSDDLIYVDASTDWGIGLLINNRWLAWKLKPGWRSDGRDIGWAEMVAVEVALRTLVSLNRQREHFVIHSDNQGVVHSIRAGTSRGIQQNAILRHIVSLIQSHGLWLTTEWVSTNNNPADCISRGAPPSVSKQIHPRPQIPSHLVHYLSYV